MVSKIIFKQRYETISLPRANFVHVKPLRDFILSFEVSAVEASASSSASVRLFVALATEIGSYPSDCELY